MRNLHTFFSFLSDRRVSESIEIVNHTAVLTKWLTINVIVWNNKMLKDR